MHKRQAAGQAAGQLSLLATLRRAVAPRDTFHSCLGRPQGLERASGWRARSLKSSCTIPSNFALQGLNLACDGSGFAMFTECNKTNQEPHAVRGLHGNLAHLRPARLAPSPFCPCVVGWTAGPRPLPLQPGKRSDGARAPLPAARGGRH